MWNLMFWQWSLTRLVGVVVHCTLHYICWAKDCHYLRHLAKSLGVVGFVSLCFCWISNRMIHHGLKKILNRPRKKIILEVEHWYIQGKGRYCLKLKCRYFSELAKDPYSILKCSVIANAMFPNNFTKKKLLTAFQQNLSLNHSSFKLVVICHVEFVPPLEYKLCTIYFEN